MSGADDRSRTDALTCYTFASSVAVLPLLRPFEIIDAGANHSLAERGTEHLDVGGSLQTLPSLVRRVQSSRA